MLTPQYITSFCKTYAFFVYSKMPSFQKSYCLQQGTWERGWEHSGTWKLQGLSRMPHFHAEIKIISAPKLFTTLSSVSWDQGLAINA